MAATAANWTTVRLSSGICANILDFGIPQKHVLRGVPATETGCEAGVPERQAGGQQSPVPTLENKERKQGREASK
jgi:hypothetical protein